ncbi:hypothetical protein NSDW_10280 [Novosphingobium olei]|nr:hypothetical protein NSDW_10280 [Novosphingobium olei]
MNALVAPPVLPGAGLARLRGFVTNLAELIDSTRSEREILESGAKLLARLVNQDDWLPEAYAKPDPDRYRQYLLHCDARASASAWSPSSGGRGRARRSMTIAPGASSACCAAASARNASFATPTAA